jgi:hypothetical protein
LEDEQHTEVPRLLTIRQAAAVLGKSVDWMYAYARAGHEGVYKSSDRRRAHYDIDPDAVRGQMRLWAITSARSAEITGSDPPHEGSVQDRESLEEYRRRLKDLAKQRGTVA